MTLYLWDKQLDLIMLIMFAAIVEMVVFACIFITLRKHFRRTQKTRIPHRSGFKSLEMSIEMKSFSTVSGNTGETVSADSSPAEHSSSPPNAIKPTSNV